MDSGEVLSEKRSWLLTHDMRRDRNSGVSWNAVSYTSTYLLTSNSAPRGSPPFTTFRSIGQALTTIRQSASALSTT